MTMYLKPLLVLSLSSFVAADLRMASQPRIGYQLRDQGTTPWKAPPRTEHMHHRYMEPSTFGYKGLEHQKRRNYDNFLRSNIDNEQDNRNFDDEDGKDHLPFRTSETDVFENYNFRFGRSRIQQDPLEIELTKVVEPGDSMMVPLRWNNPHASEMEVNIWIFDHGSEQPVVVPIRKPSCSGEGHQDNVISFTVPEDFKTLGSKIPGFEGCNEDSEPMCSLQIYSHSVESRTYALGFPIVIPGHDTSLKTTDSDKIQSVSKDPLLDLSDLRDICLPATDPSATISSAVPRWARLVSDVYNHAYQNSDYSPYSGQQHEYISKNLQASAVNKMEVGNRGELGKSILPKATYDRLRYLQRLESRVYKNYESLANKIIRAVGSKMESTGTIGTQPLAKCFRCAEGGSTTTKRIQTNTYIPSFQLSEELVPAASKIVPSRYAKLITESGLVQIYVAAMNDLLPYFYKSRHLGIMYQPAVAKPTTATLLDVTNFKKRNEEDEKDGGKYAATEAKKMLAWNAYACPGKCLFANQKKVYANACRGDDCKSIATCPEGQQPIKCEVAYRRGRSDGIIPTSDTCTVYGGHRRSTVKAAATCAEQSTSVAVSGEIWEDRKKLTASCPAGESVLACYCYSPWSSCGGETFKPNGSVCEKTIGRSTSHRRRGVGGGAGAKLYAVCSKEPAELVEFPLSKYSAGTNVTGECAPCVQLFGKELKSPPVTPLDKEIGWTGEPSSIANIPDNPDGEHSQPEDPKPSTRRRRRHR